MAHLSVEVLRGGLVESVHRVSAAVVDSTGRLIAAAGNPELVTYWRSAAKPFQALPLVDDGVLDHFNLGKDALALACASHSSEPRHLELTDRMLQRIGCTEDDLACGPHPPISPEVARQANRDGTTLTPRWSNCSGKHAGMLALARHHGWETRGYERAGHPVQERILRDVVQWTGLDRGKLVQGVDGCTTVCFGLPVTAMARAYAALASGATAGLRQVRDAMLAHPELIAGEGRFCTDVMRVLPGAVIAKVGAEGIHCAALPGTGLGVALKVEDGDMRASPPALLLMLDQLATHLSGTIAPGNDALREWRSAPVLSTRDVPVGETRATGSLQFFAAG
jgi:L-asparaginase II